MKTKGRQFSSLNRLTNCRICGKRTHTNTGGMIGIELCPKCLLEAETENSHNDGCHEMMPDPGCKQCQEAIHAE